MGCIPKASFEVAFFRCAEMYGEVRIVLTVPNNVSVDAEALVR